MNNNTGGSWKSETDADGIIWLTLDKPGTSANVLSSGVLLELDALCDPCNRARREGWSSCPPRRAVS